MSNERKHAELIKRWAENKDLKVESRYRMPGADWKYDVLPIWDRDIDYRLIEPDPFKHLKEVLSQGRQIEFNVGKSTEDVDKWVQLHDDGNILWQYPPDYYRIKPEPKYIPFDISDAEKLIGKVVKRKGTYVLRVILEIRNSVTFQICMGKDHETNFKSLFELYTFLDGTPCGKLVEDEGN